MKAPRIPQVSVPEAPPPPNPPVLGQNMVKKKGGGATPSSTFLGSALAATPGQTGQKTLLGQ